MTPRCLKKTLVNLTSPGRPLARQPAVPEVEAECGGEEGGQDGEGDEEAPWHGAATGDAALLQTPTWSSPTERRNDHAAQTVEHSTVHNTQTQRVMSHVKLRHIEEPGTTCRSSTSISLVPSVSLC